MGDYIVNDNPSITLNINGKKRYAEAVWNPKTQQYLTLLPAEELIDGSSPANGDAPDVQGHLATFDKDGKLLGVEALGWGPEGGFYGTKWPTPADSVYNANAAKTYAPQVFKQVKRQENGGNMNYSQYLQEGGAAEDQMGQVVSQVIAALKQNPKETLKKLQEMGEQGDQLLEMAIKADPELQQMFSDTMKCGGKVKAKVKKKEVGGFVRKAGTGCACQLKKVGGRLIEVDGCTGLPVKRDGGIMKFEIPATKLQINNQGGAKSAYEIAQENIQKNRVYTVHNDGKGIKNYITDNYGNVYYDNGTMKGSDNKMYSYDMNIIPEDIRTNAFGAAKEEEEKIPEYNSLGQKYNPETKQYEGLTYEQRNAARIGWYGSDGKTGATVNERKAWMNSDEGKAYLASINNGQGLGFTADQYTGTAAQNRALFRAYGGYSAWKAKKDAAAAAADPNANRQQMRDVSYTNQQLLDMADDDPRLAANAQLKAARDKAKSQYSIMQNYDQTYQVISRHNNDMLSRQNSATMDSAMQGAAHDKLAQDRFNNSLAALNRVKVFDMDDAARQDYFKTLSPAERLRQQRLYNAQVAARNKYSTVNQMSAAEHQNYMNRLFDANAVGYTGQEPVTAQKYGGIISYQNYLTSK